MIWNKVWSISLYTLGYTRFYPNPGFMIPIWPGRRLRWSWHFGVQITKAPTASNPTGLTPTQLQVRRRR